MTNIFERLEATTKLVSKKEGGPCCGGEFERLLPELLSAPGTDLETQIAYSHEISHRFARQKSHLYAFQLSH